MSYKPRYKVTQGSELTLDGLKWLVEVKDRDGYIVSGPDGEQTTLSFQRVDAAIEASTCEVVLPKQVEALKRLREFTGGYDRIDQLPDQQKNARAWMCLIQAVEDLEREGQKITHRYLDQVLVRKELYKRATEIANDVRLFEGVTIGPTRVSDEEADSVVPKGRTICDRRKNYDRFGRNPVALIHRHHMKGIQDPKLACKLSEWQIQFVMYCLNTKNGPTQPQMAPIYKVATRLFPVPEAEFLLGKTHPSITTVRNWQKGLSTLAVEIGRLGKRRARNVHGAGASELRAVMYGERAAMDQAYLSVFVDPDGNWQTREIDPEKVSPELGPNEVMRVWLHFMIDVATRLPLAWILSESAHSDHTQALMRMATRDKTREKVKYGCKMEPAPAAGLLLTVADNGTATRNGAVYSSQMGAGMMVQTGRTYHSNDNPHAERVFGTFQFQVLNFEGGYVGSRPDELPGYDPKANTHLGPDDLYGVVTRYFVDEYSHTKHRGHGMYGATPYEKLEQTKETYGEIDAPSPEARRIHFGMKKTMSTNSEGILFDFLPYNSPELGNFHGGKSKKVNIYLDPDFLHTVTIQPVRSKQTFTAKLTMTALQDLTYEEAMKVMKDTAQANPEKRKTTNEMVGKARADRAKLSGFYMDPQLPESYRTIAQLEKEAAALTQIGVSPDYGIPEVVRPGSITKRPRKEYSHPRRDAVETTAPPKNAPGASFAPIKESKL